MTDETTAPEEKPKEQELQIETRLNEFELQAFQSMGCPESGPSPAIVDIYFAYKQIKDKLQPGRLSAEGFAFAKLLGDMADGQLSPGGSTE